MGLDHIFTHKNNYGALRFAMRNFTAKLRHIFYFKNAMTGRYTFYIKYRNLARDYHSKSRRLPPLA
nr:MAG TPA: hypothetical protein [Caudoviricetes sp.]DAI07913.1 MAG TPA: hypothetical protein [Caudoviricetes sp.]